MCKYKNGLGESSSLIVSPELNFVMDLTVSLTDPLVHCNTAVV